MSAAAAPAAGVEPEAGVAETTPPPDPTLVATNTTNKRLIVRSQDGLVLQFAPLERRELKRSTLERYDLEPLLARSFLLVEELPPETTAGAIVIGGGFWGAAAWLVAGLAYDAPWWYWLGGGALLLLVIVAVWRASSSGAVGRWFGRQLMFAVVLGVGIGLPAAAIIFGTNLWQVADQAWNGEGLAQERAVLTLVGRAMQLLYIALVALLPGLLYFLFDRARLSTLRERFTRHIFRFDRTVQTCADIQARYGSVLDEAYGPAGPASVRLQPGKQAPILVATVAIAFGWVLTLLNPEVEVVRKANGLTALFEPWSSPVAFAFLGAYFFALFAVLRGYVRGDLRPKTYTYIAIRIIVAVVLAWVLDAALPSGDGLLVVAFFAGVVPDTALYRLRELARLGAASRKSLEPMFDRLPLTALDGIDLYERARLETEGVTNIEALAHHDVVDLMLQTRIPVPRLVSWTDQAILALYTGLGPPLEALRAHGIRTATDLERAFAAAEERGGGAVDELLAVWPPARVALDTFADEEWMDALRYWRDPMHLREQTIRHPEDFQP